MSRRKPAAEPTIRTKNSLKSRRRCRNTAPESQRHRRHIGLESRRQCHNSGLESWKRRRITSIKSGRQRQSTGLEKQRHRQNTDMECRWQERIFGQECRRQIRFCRIRFCRLWFRKWRLRILRFGQIRFRRLRWQIRKTNTGRKRAAEKEVNRHYSPREPKSQVEIRHEEGQGKQKSEQKANKESYRGEKSTIDTYRTKLSPISAAVSGNTVYKTTYDIYANPFRIERRPRPWTSMQYRNHTKQTTLDKVTQKLLTHVNRGNLCIFLHSYVNEVELVKSNRNSSSEAWHVYYFTKSWEISRRFLFIPIVGENGRDTHSRIDAHTTLKTRFSVTRSDEPYTSALVSPMARPKIFTEVPHHARIY